MGQVVGISPALYLGHSFWIFADSPERKSVFGPHSSGIGNAAAALIVTQTPPGRAIQRADLATAGPQSPNTQQLGNEVTEIWSVLRRGIVSRMSFLTVERRDGDSKNWTE